MNTKNLTKLIPIFFPKELFSFASKKKDLYGKNSSN